MNNDTCMLINVMTLTGDVGYASGPLADVAEFLAGYYHDGDYLLDDYHPALASIDFWAVDWLAVAAFALGVSC